MTRALAFIVAFAVGFAGAAIAAPRLRLVIPVEVSNLPPAVIKGRVHCLVSSAESYDATRVIGDAWSEFAIEGGRYSGRIGMDVLPEGFPVGTDGTTEARSYSCALFLMYRCSTPDGADGWCTSAGGGRAMPTTPAPVAALFATDPARPPSAIIQGTISRAGATTLPIRSM